MSLRPHIYIFLLLFLSLVGCTKEQGQGSDAETGTVVLKISGTSMTKAESLGVLTADEDKVIRNLSVWLVQSGTVKALHTSSPETASAIVEFDEVLRGDYKLYIVANYDGNLTATNPVGSTSIDAMAQSVMGEVTAGNSPTYTSDSGIPASLEMDISVSPGNNIMEAHLKRSVGRLSIIFRNMTEHDLYLGDMSISDYNPSHGYLFGQNHAIPSTSSYLAFPSLSGYPVKIENETVVFDHYLYETGYPSSPFELAFDAGLYTEGASPTYENTSVTSIDITVGANKTSLSDGDMFMIRSVESSKFYVGADDSGLVCTEFGSDDNIQNSSVADNYLWVRSSGKIKNVATGKYISLDSESPTTSNDGTDITISYSTYFTISNNHYYLAMNATNTGVLGSSSSYNWDLRSVTRTETTEEKKAFTGDNATFLTRMEKKHTHVMKYLDSYGVAQPLTHICRNEHIKLTVNISYQQSTGGFGVSVTDWIPDDNETTFD